jgi:16S rRNA (cytosine967-C5)-methyltransferase
VLPSPPTLPRAVEERWLASWGRDMIDAARRAMAEPPPLDLSFSDQRAAQSYEGRHLAPRHARLAPQRRIGELAGFVEGAWWVQDLAASIPARLLGQGNGRTVLDLCAAPGGKTLQLAAAGWAVTAVDSSAARLERLRENLERTRLSAAVVEADVMRWQPAEPADAILLDAPCSATGIYRRHPDVLHRVRPRVIAEMAELQRAMLARAAEWLKPGGTFVFSTCSLEPAEGEAHLGHAPRLTFDPVRTDELPNGIAPHADGHVRTLPTMLADKGALDGFFIARFRRG